MSTEHVKYYNSEGIEVPSCTTVLKLYNKNLDGWANMMGLRRIKLDEYLEQTARVGTYIHSVVEKYFNPTMTPDTHPDTNYISPQDYPILLSKLKTFDEYMRENGYEPYAQEMVIHGEKYGGTIDLLFYNKTIDKYILIDVKTAKSTYGTMYMQLMGYCQLLKEKHNIEVAYVGILLIKRDPYDEEFCKLYRTDDKLCRHKLEIFNHLLNIYYLLTDEERLKLVA